MPPFSTTTQDRERDKFIQRPTGETSVRTWVSNDSSEPIPVSVDFTKDGATTPTIYNLSLPVANTEYSQALSTNTKRILIRARVGATLRVAFVSGDTLTNYFTMAPRTVYSEENLDLVGVTIYLQSDVAGNVAEILEWK